ncbi:MAG: cytochrome oxidase assembly protein [Opitutus sp.]|nr:cytochrome oxidase assembly protein [Opitutus sp.]
MDASPTSRRTLSHKSARALFAALGSAWVFVLVTLGAFTTSIGAGMAFPDWPLSNGSLNPTGWLDNLSSFAEHSHRLSAGVMSAVTIVLAVWLWRSDPRAWLRQLAWFAVGLVLAQALVGGLRVLLDSFALPSLETSVGRLLAMLHACLAQIFVCTLIALAVACSRGWTERAVPVGAIVRRAGVACCLLLLGQLALAAVLRHSFAGLAIPTFPYSTPDGGLLPAHWDFRVVIHFSHRVMAAVLAVALPVFSWLVVRDRGATFAMRTMAAALVSLLALQIFLGAQIIWTQRTAAMTTGHVLVGALTLAATFWLTLLAHRDLLENKPAS